MKILFVIGLFLMFSGIVVAASRPSPGSQQATEPSKGVSRFITYSVFGGFVLVIIAWVASLKGQTA